jgi:hypothetical protein
MYIETIFRNICNRVFHIRSDVNVELQGIDRKLSLSGVSLQGCSVETLWEEESRDPERVRGSIVPPVGHEL